MHFLKILFLMMTLFLFGCVSSEEDDDNQEDEGSYSQFDEDPGIGDTGSNGGSEGDAGGDTGGASGDGSGGDTGAGSDDGSSDGGETGEGNDECSPKNDDDETQDQSHQNDGDPNTENPDEAGDDSDPATDNGNNEQPDDIGGPPSVFFSEYLKGNQTMSALEIYNASAESADLGKCSITIHENGSSNDTNTINLSGALAPGKTFVIYHPFTSNNAYMLHCKALENKKETAGLDFDGNDPIVLSCGGTTMDIIGQIGGSINFGVEKTWRRKAEVVSGDVDGSDSFSFSTEWDGFTVGTFDGLGEH